MRRLLRPTMIIVLLVSLLLAACDDGGESDSQTQLDAPFRAATLTAEVPTATVTAIPTEWSTPTPRPSATAPPTFTPYPLRERDNGTEEPFDDFIAPSSDWLDAEFYDAEGEARTLREFLGRVVLIHTLGINCDLCPDQQRTIAQVVQDRFEIEQMTDQVVLALGVADDDPDLLRSVIQRWTGDDWASLAQLEDDATQAEFIVAQASQALIDALVRDFGPLAGEPDGLTLILIERDGVGHVMTEGLVRDREIRNGLTFYNIVGGE